MKPIAYSLQFRGRVDEVSAHVLEASASAPGSVLETTVGDDGVRGRFRATPEGDEAVRQSRLVFDGGDSFDETGAIVFGRGNVLRFRTVGLGHLAPSPDPHLRHGTVVWEVEGGEGQFEGASGRITSNFFVSDTGEMTDNQFGLVFVNNQGGER
jgi:hypothetical protein